MREIEFRAYSKSLKRMLSFEHLQEATKGMVDVANAEIQKRGLKFNKLSPYGLFLPLEDDDLEFMQFTGLTDKNGKKIFEGDIVKYINTQSAVYDVGRKMCGFIVFDEDCQAYMSKNNLQRDFDWCFGDKLEVIGNIYDNPEMTKENEDD